MTLVLLTALLVHLLLLALLALAPSPWIRLVGQRHVWLVYLIGFLAPPLLYFIYSTLRRQSIFSSRTGRGRLFDLIFWFFLSITAFLLLDTFFRYIFARG